MEKITFFSKPLVNNGKLLTYVIDTMLYKRINSDLLDKYSFIMGKLNEYIKNKKSNSIQTNFRLKSNDLISLCDVLNKHFDLSDKSKLFDLSDKSKLSTTVSNPLNLPPYFPKSPKMKMIGRMETIKELSKYKTTAYSYLILPEGQHNIDWSPTINDAFILCGYQDALNNLKNSIYTFTLVLVVDKKYNDDNNFIRNDIINPEAHQIDHDTKCREKNECKNKHIFPPASDYNSTTPQHCKSVDSNHKTECFNLFPSVTFTEIILLTKYFDMDCYLLANNEKYYYYFFCKKGFMKKTVDDYNKIIHNSKEHLIKINVTSSFAHIRSKYLKYKSKYIALLNNM